MKFLLLTIKELTDFSRRKGSVATLILAPSIVALLLTGVVGLSADSFRVTPDRPIYSHASLPDAQALETETDFMLVNFLSIIMVILPVTWASQSIVAERTRKTLEPLLSSPIGSTSVLIGKALTPVIVAVLVVSWCLVICGIVKAWQTHSFTMVKVVLFPPNLGTLFLVDPLLAFASALFALGISARSTDPRAAMQRSTLLSLPILIGSSLLASFVGMGKLSLALFGVPAATLIAAGAFIYAKSKFQREQLII
jgi:ABC-2 type transport system permease protein